MNEYHTEFLGFVKQQITINRFVLQILGKVVKRTIVLEAIYSMGVRYIFLFYHLTGCVCLKGHLGHLR